jgi:hypothetical protein
MISNELRNKYGSLFHEVRELDRNCHRLSIVWSPDGGFTRLAIDLKRGEMEQVLDVLPAKAVRAWIRDFLNDRDEDADDTHAHD